MCIQCVCMHFCMVQCICTYVQCVCTSAHCRTIAYLCVTTRLHCDITWTTVAGSGAEPVKQCLHLRVCWPHVLPPAHPSPPPRCSPLSLTLTVPLQPPLISEQHQQTEITCPASGGCLSDPRQSASAPSPTAAAPDRHVRANRSLPYPPTASRYTQKIQRNLFCRFIKIPPLHFLWRLTTRLFFYVAGNILRSYEPNTGLLSNNVQ